MGVAFATACGSERAVGWVEACSLPRAWRRVAPVPGDGDIAVIPAVGIGRRGLGRIGCGQGLVQVDGVQAAHFIARPIKADLIQRRASFAGNQRSGRTGGRVDPAAVVEPVPGDGDIAIAPAVGISRRVRRGIDRGPTFVDPHLIGRIPGIACQIGTGSAEDLNTFAATAAGGNAVRCVNPAAPRIVSPVPKHGDIAIVPAVAVRRRVWGWISPRSDGLTKVYEWIPSDCPWLLIVPV